VDELDQSLLRALQANSRESVTALSKALGVTRPTVQERINRLERRGIIRGYTISVDPDYARKRVSAYVMISIEPKAQAQVTAALTKLGELESLHSVSGAYDLVALLNCESTVDLEVNIDKVSEITGVQRTLTSVVLSEKYRR
jgi:DNA-binding Lrp family transcriptional regulator